MHPWPGFPHRSEPIPGGRGWLLQATPDAPPLQLWASEGVAWSPAGWWHERVTQPREAERGFDSEEDIYCPALATLALRKPGQSVALIGTIEADAPADPDAALRQIERHQRKLFTAAGSPSRTPVKTAPTGI
jgi:hypothetical protein